MELNTEINKIFGAEMAKIFASSISEEELQEKARDIWTQLNAHESSWGRRSDSEIETCIKRVLLERLHKKILMILEEPENDEDLEQRARDMVAKARQIADEAIVRSMADSMVNRTLNVYNSHDKFVDDVLQVLMCEKASGLS